MLHEQTLGRMAIVVDEAVERDVLEHWLKVHNVKAALYEVLESDDPDMKAEKIQRLATSMGRSDWYVDNDAATCARTLHLGIPTLLACAPYVVRPEWNNTKVHRPWSELVEEVDRQAVMRAEKTWGDL